MQMLMGEIASLASPQVDGGLTRVAESEEVTRTEHGEACQSLLSIFALGA